MLQGIVLVKYVIWKILKHMYVYSFYFNTILSISMHKS